MGGHPAITPPPSSCFHSPPAHLGVFHVLREGWVGVVVESVSVDMPEDMPESRYGGGLVKVLAGCWWWCFSVAVGVFRLGERKESIGCLVDG